MSPQQKIIYYIDDDADDRAFLQDAITEKGHVVITFENEDALLSGLNSAVPEYIFFDEFMPLKPGSQIIRDLRQCPHFSTIKFILFYNALSIDKIQEYLDYGTNYIVEKPRRLEDYGEVLQTVINMDWNSYKPDAATIFNR